MRRLIQNMRLSKEIYDFGLPDDRMNFFLQKVVQKYRANLYMFGREKSFAYISVKDVRCILGEVKYKHRLNYLLNMNYVKMVEIGTHKLSGNSIMGYIPLVQDYKKKKTHYKFIDNYYNNIESTLSPISKQILRNLRKSKINITQNKFWDILGVPEDMEKLLSYKYILRDIVDFNNSSPKEINEYITEDNFGRRVHTLISRLPKKIRSMVLIEGEKTIEIDLKQSQPVIFGKMLESKIGANSFSYLVRRKDLYLELVDKIENITRDDAKKIFYQIVFGSRKTKHTEVFFKIFPDIKDFVNKTKKEKISDNPSKKTHSNIAFLLQRKESEIFRQVWAFLKKERITFLTVHDSVIVQEKNLNKSLNIITRILSKHIHSDISVEISV